MYPGRYDNCPCGSGRKSKWCCLTTDGRWHKRPATVFPPPPKTEYSNPKCYAAFSSDCSTKICREHYISKNVLSKIDGTGFVKAAGLGWQQPETFSTLPVEAIVARVLCIRHGEGFGVLDAEFGRFFGLLEQIDDALRERYVRAFSLFSGEDIERWMLKVLLGGEASNNLPARLKDECLQILYGITPWPVGWGIYLQASSEKPIYHSNSIRIEIFSNPSTGRTVAVRFEVRGLPFLLCLGVPDSPAGIGIYRPRKIVLAKGKSEWTIEFSWSDISLQKFIRFERQASYDGSPPDWREWERKG